MDREDARHQKLERLLERCKQVDRLHRKGHGVMAIVEPTGLSYPAVRRAIDLYEAGGAAALKPAARGCAPGQSRRLSSAQGQLVRRTRCEKRPD